MVLNIADIIRWSLHKSPKNVAAMYEKLSPLMCGLTHGTMLNFGYWDKNHCTPALAQKNMCDMVADMARFGDSAHSCLTVLDVGCGMCSPAIYWKSLYPTLDIHCINTSYKQLHDAMLSGFMPTLGAKITDQTGTSEKSFWPNLTSATATMLPFTSKSADCIIALESAQHFNPLESFVAESKRILKDAGVLIVAIPVLVKKSFTRLGILNFTWASEHYTLEHAHQKIMDNGFQICDERLVGAHVYGPLADYYMSNRLDIRQSVKQMGYSMYLESMIMASMKKMKKTFDAGMIDYAILQCRI